MLACARFSPDGKLMVTNKKTLPFQALHVSKTQTSFADDLDNSHPAFQWIIRVSHNWASISHFLPSMRKHLRAAGFTNETVQGNNDATTVDDSLPGKLQDKSLLFRESFCVAASGLANDLKEELVDLGTLHHEIFQAEPVITPASSKRKSLLHRISETTPHFKTRAEKASSLQQFGTGQLLLLAKLCDKNHVRRLEDEGYRFVAIENIIESLAASLDAPKSDLSHHLHRLKEQTLQSDTNVRTGTHLGCFALRPGVAKMQWEVLVLKTRPEELPSVQIAPEDLDGETKRTLDVLNGFTAEACIAHLDRMAKSTDLANARAATKLGEDISRLANIVAEPFFMQATLGSTLLSVPTYNKSSGHASSYNLLVFHVIPDVHMASLKLSTALTYTPLSLFLCRQKVLNGASHASSFVRQVHQELSIFYSQNGFGQAADTASPPASLSINRWSLGRFKYFRSTKDEVAVVKGSLESTTEEIPCAEESKHSRVKSSMPFGGIMVSQDVELLLCETSSKSPCRGTTGIVQARGTEEKTYIDELCSLTIEWHKTKKRTTKLRGD